MAQLKAVMLLGRTGRARSRELADGLGIAPSAATPLVDRLVEQKLARRVDDAADRRIVWIHPTQKAEAIYNELLEINEQILADVLKEVPAQGPQSGEGRRQPAGRRRDQGPREGQTSKIETRGEVAERSKRRLETR